MVHFAALNNDRSGENSRDRSGATSTNKDASGINAGMKNLPTSYNVPDKKVKIGGNPQGLIETMKTAVENLDKRVKVIQE